MTMLELHWTEQGGLPLLAVLQLLPLAAAVLLHFLRAPRAVFPLAVAIAVLELLLAIGLYHRFDTGQTAMQFAEHLPLLPPLAYHAAVDGISVLFILLTAALSLLVVLYAPVRGLAPLTPLLSVVFAIEAMLMSAFTTVDLLWFVLVTTLQLMLVGYQMWRWATSPERDMALTRFYQFMGTSVLMLLIGIGMLAWNHADAVGGRWTFDLFQLAGVSVATPVQSVVFFLLFYGLAVRIPIFPFHGWLPVAAEHGNIAVGPVFLLGLKVGVYGLLRFVFPLLPEAVEQWHAYVVAFAVTGVFYAALLALLQENLRRLLAYAVVSHTSILIIGLFSLNHYAFQGSLLLSVNFGLAITGLLMMTGLVHRRTNTTLLSNMGGLFDRIPFIGIAFLVSGLSIVGMPGTPGFDAAHLVLEAAIERFGALVTIAAALGNVAAAGFLLWAFQRAFLAPRPEGAPPLAIDRMSTLEWVVAIGLIAILLGAGFYSEPWLQLIDTSLTGLSARFSPH